MSGTPYYSVEADYTYTVVYHFERGYWGSRVFPHLSGKFIGYTHGSSTIGDCRRSTEHYIHDSYKQYGPSVKIIEAMTWDETFKELERVQREGEEMGD